MLVKLQQTGAAFLNSITAQQAARSAHRRTPATGVLAGLSCKLSAATADAVDVEASFEEAILALSSAALCLAASKTDRWSFRTPAGALGKAGAARRHSSQRHHDASLCDLMPDSGCLNGATCQSPLSGPIAQASQPSKQLPRMGFHGRINVQRQTLYSMICDSLPVGSSTSKYRCSEGWIGQAQYTLLLWHGAICMRGKTPNNQSRLYCSFTGQTDICPSHRLGGM